METAADLKTAVSQQYLALAVGLGAGPVPHGVYTGGQRGVSAQRTRVGEVCRAVQGCAGPERGAVARRASEEETFWSGARLDVEVGGVRNATWRNGDPGSRSRGDGAVAGAAASCLGSVAKTWHVRFC